MASFCLTQSSYCNHAKVDYFAITACGFIPYVPQQFAGDNFAYLLKNGLSYYWFMFTFNVVEYQLNSLKVLLVITYGIATVKFSFTPSFLGVNFYIIIVGDLKLCSNNRKTLINLWHPISTYYWNKSKFNRWQT